MQSHSLSDCSWRVRDVDTKTWIPAQVPGCVHTDLLRAGRIPDPFFADNELGLQWIEEREWEYRTTFTVPAALRKERVLELVADGLDTVATVTLNGRRIGRTDNMFVGHRWNVKKHLRPGKNELVIRFSSAMDYVRTHHRDLIQGELNDPKGLAPAIRKQQCQFGWDWGPRFVTAGIWQDLRLEAWTHDRLLGVKVTQDHRADGTVALAFEAELASGKPGTCRGSVSGRSFTPVEDSHAVIQRPALWWPNGQGEAVLYLVELEVLDAKGRTIDTWEKMIGLRTIELDRHADAAGETFQFVVNGRPIFAKGANWIPAHAFVTSLDYESYARDLQSAAQANMNMIRVWGGGIYESEEFYDLCDSLGLLVWQDFMFACAVYPGTDAFVASVREEAEQQVRRLRHRASLALWCGNNEIEQLNGQRLEAKKARAEYAAVFERALPEVVARIDGVTAYWQSSQHRPDFDNGHAAGEKHGDTHFWDVWHARQPVKDYEKWRFRFCSEFGMQSYSSPETNATFCPPGEGNVFSAAMENHQKNRGGNQVVLDYVSRRYRFPKSQDDLIYLSQLNQAYCMQIGVEHYRRTMPHCMGALYWQLNDCWPVASWSSIEFTGRWRALHHVARRFFAPALVSAHVPGDETAGVGNYRHSTVREVHLYTVYDAPKPAAGVLLWELWHLDGTSVLRGQKKVALRYGESIRQHTLDLERELETHGREQLVLRIALDVGEARVSEDTVFLTPPRFANLPRGRVQTTVRLETPTRALLTFVSKVFQHRVAFDLPGVRHFASDNYFELYAGEAKSITVHLSEPTTAAALKKLVTTRSLVDTY